MTKIYQAPVFSKNNSFRNFLTKKIILVFIGLLGVFGNLQAQVTIGITPYTTLKAAFDAINSGAKTGAIIVNISGNTTEAAMAVLNSSGTGAANYTSVLVRPTANVTVSGSLSNAIIQLFGADNVTIDGLVGGFQLTINNTSASTGSAVIWIGSASASDGATNNIIRNCKVNGQSPTTTLIGIVTSSGTTIGGVAEAANNNNTIQNNTVTTSLYGIALVGPTGNESGNIISGNTIGSVTPGNKMSLRSIFVAQEQGVSVTQNTIFGNSSATTTPANTGIFVGGTISGGTIDKNMISDIKKASIWGCSGIQLNSSSPTTGLTIANNMIYDVAAGGFNGTALDDNGYGIAVATGGGYNIYYNSVNLNTNQTVATGTTAALWLSTSITTSGTLDVRNNIFANSQTTSTRLSVFSPSSNAVFSNINYNDYYSTGSVGSLNGATSANLAAWQAATGQDANSVAANPSFFTPTNLHLFFNSPLNALATPIAGITSDIDGDVRNASTPDIGADEFTPPTCSANTGGTATANPTTICASGTTTISATGYAYGIGISYQWEYSTNSGGTWNTLTGETNPFSATASGLPGNSWWFRLKVICSNCCGAAPGYSTTAIVTVNNPQVSGTTPGSRCGVGTVNLAATAASGNVNWYANPTGGTSLFTGSPFTTPVISSTTPFYVSASINGSVISAGKTSTAGADGGYTGPDAGLVFDATSAFTLLSVKMYPQGASNVTIEARDNSGALIPGCTTVVNFTGATSTGVVVPLNFNIPVGTGHRIIVNGNTSNIDIWRDFTGATYPYAIGTMGSITNGWITGTIGTYYFFYDWQVQDICEGSRVPVTATVNTPPAFTLVSPAAGAPRTICSGNCVTLNVTSTNPGYIYSWSPGGAGASHLVCPTQTTSYTLTANDGTCRRDSTITITVNPQPQPLTVTPVTATSCAGIIVPISVTGGQLLGQSVFGEAFETFPLTQMTVTGSGITASPNTTYYSQGTQSVLLTYGNSIDGQLAMSNSVNLSLYANPKLTFSHICALEDGFDYGYVQYSTDGGTTWTSFPTGAYTGTGTLMNGVVSFSADSYSDWLAQVDNGATPGTGPATALWKTETINLAAYQSSTTFKVRFRITSDGSLIYFGWLLDDIKITGDGQAPITWTPCGAGTELYSNIAGTILYVCGTPATTVYSNPTTNHVYTATATGGVGCSQTATSTVNVIAAAPPSVSISAVGGTTICTGDCITFNATVLNGGGNPGYKWFVNNVQVNLPASFNANPGQNPYTICGLLQGDKVECQILSNAGSCAIPNPSPKSNALTITVNPKPTVSINGPLTVCFPQPLTLTTTGTISTYQWLLNGGPVGINSSTYTALIPGTYSCIVTSNQGCKDTAADKILVQQTYTITPTVANGTISPSGTVTLNCGDNQSFTYTANPGYQVCDVLIDGISVGTPASPYVFTNVTANHTIDVNFCNPGCASVYTAFAGTNTSVCGNATYSLASGSPSISSTPAVPGFTATWSTSGTGTFFPSSAFGVATTYTPSLADVGTTVVLTLTTNDPLGTPCAAASASMNLIVKPYPVVTITGQLGLCPTGATTRTLTASATIASGTIIGYNWYNSVNAIIGSSPAQLITTTGNYSVTSNATNGCSTNVPFTMIAFTNPSTPTITGTATICQGTSTSLTANVASPGNGAATLPANGYQWYNPASIAGATNQIYSATIAPATYTVTVTNSNGCLSAASGGYAITYDATPLNGAYTIGVGPASCTNYVSFASAINDLNTRSISGNVRFDIPAGYVETVPVFGLRLGSAALNTALTGPPAYSLTFRKNGVGANPILNAYATGTSTVASAIPDGIWSLNGIDNVVIDGIDLFDGNASGTALMEYGFGLFKRTATDGAQNNLIQNCTVTLKRANDVSGASLMPDGSAGIVVMNSLVTNANAFITPTSAAGTNSNNKFYTNTIQNCNTGIAFNGYGAPSPFTLGDTGNDVGGIALSTGNNIINYGGAVATTATAVGIRINNQWGLNVSYNTINNNTGAGVNHTNNLRGILGVAGLSASMTMNNNTITLKSSAVGAFQVTAIDNTIGATPAANTISINNNTITGTYTTATTGNMTGIINSANAATVTMTGNTVDSYSLQGSGNFIGINNAGGASTNVNLNNNILSNCNITSTGTFVGISNTVAGATNLNMSGNTVTGITKNITATVNWMQTSNSTNGIINDNIVTNNVVTAGNAAIAVNCILGGNGAYTFDGNYIYNNSITGITGGIATFTGFNNVGGATQDIITDNIIRKMFVTGTATGFLHIIQGINNNTAAASAKTFSGNTVANLYCSSTLSATVYGIRNATGGTVNIFKNKIDSLFPGQSVTAGSYAAGIRIQSGTTVNLHDNFINLDLTQATSPAANNVLTGNDALKGVEYSATTAITLNAYYNTIRLAGGGSGANFGSSGIGILNATPTVDMRNNIVVNLTTPGGTSPGFAVGYRRISVVGATYATTSNNNLFYAGTASASHLLYFDGTTGYQTMATYQAGAGISPRESASVNVSPNFISVTDLHLVPGKNCSTDGGAQVIAGYTADYDVDTRSLTTPDIGADEFNGTGVGVGVWTGLADNNWNNVGNWCDAVPDSKVNVTIPAGAPNYPLITAVGPQTKNITVATGGTITLTGAGKLDIYGTITNTGGVFNVVDGTIELAGGTAQTIPASVFQNNDLKNLVINNASVTLGGALNLYGKVSFTGSTRAFATAGFLTLKSNAAGTASVGDITNNGANTGNTITGDVMVERFISMRRAWRFLSAPTQHNAQNIHQSWQENQAPNALTPAGFGIHITSNSATWSADGFDMQTPLGPTMKTYNAGTNAWDAIPATVGVPGNFTIGKAYMTLVRGDRTINFYQPVATTTTVLRDKGALVTGTFAAPAIGAGQFAAIGNPYASAIDFAKIKALGTTTNIQDVYYLWDPYLSSLGGYVTFAGPTYTPVPSLTYTTNKYIESGQAFFVHSSGPAGTMSITEPTKVDGSYLVSRPAAQGKLLRTNLYMVDATGRNMFDGVLSEFDGAYSANVDDMDAIKMVNFGENLGISRDDKILSVERMPELVKTDTIFYNLGQMSVKNYQFEFVPDNINQPGLQAFLEDTYLNIKTPVSLDNITTIDFNIVNDPGSYAAKRFRLVFKETAPVPVTFTSIRANRQDNNILVEWKVENELNIAHYEVEKSIDGHNFNKVNEQAARGNNQGATIQYNWLDTNPVDGDNFYRIRSVGISNELKFSQVVKVNMGKVPSTITVFPNPIREDGLLYVSLTNKPAGNYQVNVLNSEGQSVMKKSLNHAGGNSVYSIGMEKYLAHGNYLVNIIGDNNVNLTFKIVY